MARHLDINNPYYLEEVNTNLELALPYPSQVGEVNTNLVLALPSLQGSTSRDMEDDEVMISSPTSFYQAVNRRNNHHRMTQITHEGARSNEGYSPEVRAEIYETVLPNVQDVLENNPQASPSISSNTAPRYSCPICMDELVQPTSTTCGHIFCKSCIRTTIAYQKKCPTCRRKITLKGTHKIYLPETIA